MSNLFMTGFELGTTVTEFNLLSGLNMAGAGTSTVSLGASTMGQGRSLILAASTATDPLTLSVPGGISAATLSAATKICVGFRAKLNSSYTGAHNYGVAGFGITTNSNLFGPCILRDAPNSLNCSVSTGTNGTSQGTVFAFPDYNAHYLTFVLTRTTGTTYTQQFYIDKVLMNTATVTFTWQADNPFALDVPYTAGTAGLNRRCFSEIDDLYVSINENALGDLIIYRAPAATDAQAQWIPYGAASNHAAIDKIDLTSTSGIQSSTSGAADLYGITDPGLARRSIYAANTTVYGTGDGVVTVTPTQKSGAASVSGTPVALNAFGGVATTGWNQTLAGTPISNFQFGVTRS